MQKFQLPIRSLFLALALVPGLMVVVHFVKTGLAGRLSLAVLAVVLAGCGLLSKASRFSQEVLDLPSVPRW